MFVPLSFVVAGALGPMRYAEHLLPRCGLRPMRRGRHQGQRDDGRRKTSNRLHSEVPCLLVMVTGGEDRYFQRYEP